MRIVIAPFTADHLEDAARLLAARHQCDREQVPNLAPEYEDAAATLRFVQELFAEEGASGVIALGDGAVSGYLLATPVLGVPTRAFNGFMHPRSVDIQQHGHASIPGYEATLFPLLYAAMAEQWLREGLVGHYVTCPSRASASEPWWELGFGQFMTAALRATISTGAPALPLHEDIEFRRATAADEPMIQEASTALFRSFSEPPMFVPFLPETKTERTRMIGEHLADPGCTFWLALSGGRLLGLLLFVEPTSPHWHHSPLEAPSGCIYLFLAYTAPEARSTGIGAALVDHALTWSREAGYAYCLVHWLPASRAARFWRGRGFQPVSYWMRRILDERSIWADGRH